MDVKEYIESGIIESYVLGLTTAEETAEVLAMYKEHAEVKNAVNEFEILLEKQISENAVMPPASIKNDLNKVLFSQTVNQDQHKTIPFTGSAVVRNINASNTSRYIAAAAIILLIISTGLNFYFYSSFKSSTDKYEALLNERNTLQANNASYKTQLDELNESFRMMESSDMVSIKMNGVKGKENNVATVYWNKNTKEVYVLPNKMEAAPEGKQYQLWAIVDGKPVDAGTIGFDCAGLCKTGKTIQSAQAFAITLEKQGGSATPTLTAMYVLGKVSS